MLCALRCGLLFSSSTSLARADRSQHDDVFNAQPVAEEHLKAPESLFRGLFSKKILAFASRDG